MATKRWRFGIAEQFLKEGLSEPYKVQKATGKSYVEAKRLIDPERKQITIDLINELCERFKCTPGDLFVADKSKK